MTMLDKVGSRQDAGVYILQNTMVVGGGNGCWGIQMKTEGVGEKNEKGKGKRKKEKNGLKTTEIRLKTNLFKGKMMC